jgi:uncharacterized protein
MCLPGVMLAGSNQHVYNKRVQEELSSLQASERMTTALSASQIEKYRRTALDREARAREAAAARRERAWAVARLAADFLKSEYAAKEVLLFGSVAHGAWFHPQSDIDLAVVGVSPDSFWKAWCAVEKLQNDFEINLVAMESVPVSLRNEIVRYGVAL